MSSSRSWLNWFDSRQVTVFGGSGFIGRRLVARLRELGARVLSPTRAQCDLEADCDLGAQLVGSEAVFMLAGVSGAAASWNEARRSLSGNCGTLQTLLGGVCTFAPRARIVFPSSRLVYGAPDRLPVAESARLAPNSPHAVHKLACEQLIDLYARRHDLRYAIARITNPYGVLGATTHAGYNIVSAMIERAKTGQQLPVFGDGGQLRDYIHIDDTVEALLLLAESAPNDVFNVGAGTGTSFIDMVRAIVAHFGSGTIVHEPWPAEYRAVETGDFVADVTRLRDLGSWTPRGFFEGLASAVAL